MNTSVVRRLANEIRDALEKIKAAHPQNQIEYEEALTIIAEEELGAVIDRDSYHDASE